MTYRNPDKRDEYPEERTMDEKDFWLKLTTRIAAASVLLTMGVCACNIALTHDTNRANVDVARSAENKAAADKEAEQARLARTWAEQAKK